ncbi:hypothetical protein HA402_002971 [Bradysia odoriphaga]|nr:hypothetical protein HA402_002971 [Bradysia odoriphaga]
MQQPQQQQQPQYNSITETKRDVVQILDMYRGLPNASDCYVIGSNFPPYPTNNYPGFSPAAGNFSSSPGNPPYMPNPSGYQPASSYNTNASLINAVQDKLRRRITERSELKANITVLQYKQQSLEKSLESTDQENGIDVHEAVTTTAPL